MYRVIERFRDLTDGHLYLAGDTFPHDERTVDPERLEALATGKNKASRALIVRVEDAPPAEAAEPRAEEAPKRPARSRKKAQ